MIPKIKLKCGRCDEEWEAKLVPDLNAPGAFTFEIGRCFDPDCDEQATEGRLEPWLG